MFFVAYILVRDTWEAGRGSVRQSQAFFNDSALHWSARFARLWGVVTYQIRQLLQLGPRRSCSPL